MLRVVAAVGVTAAAVVGVVVVTCVIVVVVFTHISAAIQDPLTFNST